MFIAHSERLHRYGPWILGGVLLLLVPSFVVMFSPSAALKQQRSELPTVNGKPIDFAAFQNTRNAVIAEYVFSAGRQPARSAEAEDQLNIEAGQRLILLRKAKEFGINATDDEVVRQVQSMPIFLNDHKQFDPDRYQRYLSFLNNLGISETQLEEAIREQIEMARLRSLITMAMKTTPAGVKLAYMPLHEATTVDYVEFKAADHKEKFDIKDDEARAFYDLNKEKFRTPGEVKVRDVYFTISDARKSITLGEDEIAEYYELNKAKYLDSQKNPKPLADVKDEVKKELLDLRAERLAGDRATSFSVKLVHEPGTARPDFAKIATDFSVTPHETGFFSLRDTVPGVSAVAQFNQAAFSLSQEVPFSDPVHGEDGYYVLEYIASQPSEIPPFDQVKAQVIDQLEHQKAREAAIKQGRDLTAKVKEGVTAGKKFSDVCASLGLKPKTAEPFTIALDTTNLPFANRVKDMALSMPTNAVSEFVLTTDGGMFFHLKERVQPTPEELKKDQSQMELQLLERDRQALFQDWASTVIRDEHFDYKSKARPQQPEAPAEDTEPVDQSAPAKS